jgi:hypothetical protein
MSRIGKIARLPEQVREQVNRRLQDGENGREIITWLNSMDEVKTVLAQGFGGHEITDSNLSDWRLGGYRDWEAQQIALAEARRVMSEGRELAETGNKALADNLAVWLTGRYIVATRKLIENGDDESAWKMLRELCHDVVALRRGDHGAEWLRIEREKLKLQRQKNARERKKAKLDSEEDAPRPPMDNEERERRYRQIFGMEPDSYPMSGRRNPFDPTPDPAVPSLPPPEAAPSASFPDPNLPTPEDGSSLLRPTSPTCPTSPTRPISPKESEAGELQQVTELAEKGDAYGQYCLGTRYRDGCGVPKDLAKAREWLGKAASQGLGNAVRELHVLILRSGIEV